MRLVVEVEKSGDGWQVQVPDPGSETPLVDLDTNEPIVRNLRRTEDETAPFPLPPQAEVDELTSPGLGQQRIVGFLHRLVVDGFANSQIRSSRDAIQPVHESLELAALFVPQVLQE